MKIDILLSTYNSSKYLNDLLDSILNQTYSDWNLIIWDDASFDDTIEIILQYQRKYPDKIFYIKSETNIGVPGSFIKLLDYSTSDYLMFCDHDDIWLPDKILKSVNKLRELENKYPQKPILVHSNLKVVDENLNIISSSFWKYSKINPKYSNNFYYLSVNNCVTGCTVLMNKYVKNIILPFNKHALMHDRWCALKVSLNGIIGWIDEPTILYRQHSSNSIGARKFSIISKFVKFRKVLQHNYDLLLMAKAANPNFSYLNFICMKIKVIFIKLLL